MFASEDESDEQQQTCCAAGRAWQQAEVLGGCAFKSEQTASLCEEAHKLCTECAGPEPKGVTWKMNAPVVNSTNSTDKVVYEMVCTGMVEAGTCPLQDVAVPVVFFAGLILLAMSLCFACLFNRVAQPAALRYLERREVSGKTLSSLGSTRSFSSNRGLKEFMAGPPQPSLPDDIDSPPLPTGEPGEMPALWDEQPNPSCPSSAPGTQAFGGSLRQAAAADTRSPAAGASFGSSKLNTKSAGSIYFEGAGGHHTLQQQQSPQPPPKDRAPLAGLQLPSSPPPFQPVSKASADASEGSGTRPPSAQISDCGSTDAGSAGATAAVAMAAVGGATPGCPATPPAAPPLLQTQSSTARELGSSLGFQQPSQQGSFACPSSPSAAAASTVAAVGGRRMLPSSSSRSSGKSGRQARPVGLARLWALRTCFLAMACLAMCCRVFHTFFRAALLETQRPAFYVAFEVLACIVPLIWCAWRLQLILDEQQSSPASSSCCSGRWLSKVHRCLVCERLPPCATFALATVCLEVYSIAASARAVANADCAVAAGTPTILYCLGIPVTVLRGHAAILAFRLHRRYTKVQRRVIDADLALGVAGFEPFSQASALPAPSPSKSGLGGELQDMEDDDSLNGDRVPHKAFGGGGMPVVDFSKGSNDSKPSFASISDSVRPMAHEWNQSCLQCTCFGWGVSLRPLSCRRLQKRTWSNTLWDVVRLGLLVCAVASVATVWAVKANDSDSNGSEAPSSCFTAQNATSTCADFESVGPWDPTIGDYYVSRLNTVEDCCGGCDGHEDCQAWLFEGSSKRCRWVKFLDEPCSEDAGDVTCRCTAHVGTSFGFKPTSSFVWMRQED
eukprot:CAMPEP_0178407042 /NCGR_PEP_ID=MMETSP0689_2-20121128/19224_1 /TAXON_ID=160604 /ORGANISM="Amphidinium massartii, Strain CS-259" /LENGTH=841 /DNA_ID=CAMNT_0020028103 /DNA_START=147 /DNA_END=2672 /DNA_ORIENTATION=-